MFKELNKFFRKDIGIDLGTANTLVYVSGQGVIINEPSVVAVNKKTGRVVAIGNEARRMLGRTPGHIDAVRPLVEGVISDFEVTEEMIAYFIRAVNKDSSRFLTRSRVVIGVPSGITNVEIRAVRDATLSAGARDVHIIENPMAAAIGSRLPVYEPVGNMVVDIGAGTTDIAVISLGGIVLAKNLRVAGDKLNQDIVNYARDEFKVLLGEKTAEEVKILIGSVGKPNQGVETAIRGRDLVSGLPREVTVTEADIREAIIKSVRFIVRAIKEIIESTPPELISDIMHRGIALTGGGSNLRGIAELISTETKIPVYIMEDPLTAVCRGTGIVLENMDSYRDILIAHEDDLPPH